MLSNFHKKIDNRLFSKITRVHLNPNLFFAFHMVKQRFLVACSSTLHLAMSVRWFVGQSVGQLVSRLVSWSVGWLVSRLVGRSEMHSFDNPHVAPIGLLGPVHS